jgi:hypothetical protein
MQKCYGIVVLTKKIILMRLNGLILALTVVVVICGCSVSKKISNKTNYGISHLKYINEFIVPNGMQFNGTTVGGLSGIDYDKDRDVYYMICDDPSARNSARYYTAKVLISQNGIDSVIFTNVTSLLNADGKPFPDIRQDLIHSADVEAMRYDPVKEEMIWSSEGQRVNRNGNFYLQDPSIVIMNRDGRLKDTFPLPVNMHIQAEEKGPRHNSVFEGMDFANNFSKLFISVEEALYEDALKAGTGDSTSWVRILKFNSLNKQQEAQYAYEISAIPYPANPPGAFKVNGISDILSLGDEKFIVIERAYSTGRIPTDIRIYLADATGAEDISKIRSLKVQPAKKPMTKKLLLDMNETLKQDVFNVEGVTFGPLLSTGNRSLIFVTDNNFNEREKTQFFLFEVIP